MILRDWRIAVHMAALLVGLIATTLAQEPIKTPAANAAREDEAARTWTDTKGQQHSGKLLAYDNIRATLQLDDGRVVFVSPQSLSKEDQEHLAEWRKDHPDAAWISPTHMPPWPRRAGTGRVKVVAVSADAPKSRYVYHSPNFAITSDVSLQLETVADMATSFEATRDAIRRLPLGLAAKPLLPPKFRNSAIFYYGPDGRVYRRKFVQKAEPEIEDNDNPTTRQRLPVELYITPQAYGLAGGASGTGGYYSTWRRTMLISLQNLGINIDENGRVRLDYRNKLFILRHEVSHQIMRNWMPHIPIWLNEGMGEYLAAAPCQVGRYQFEDLEKPFIAYLNKWRFEEDPRIIPMLAPSEMLKMTPKDWQGALNMNVPVLNYNSAALFTWYFLHQDDEGDARHLAAYFDAVRQQPQDAHALVNVHLLRGRTPEKIAAEIRTAWKQHGVDIVFQ